MIRWNLLFLSPPVSHLDSSSMLISFVSFEGLIRLLDILQFRSSVFSTSWAFLSYYVAYLLPASVESIRASLSCCMFL